MPNYLTEPVTCQPFGLGSPLAPMIGKLPKEALINTLKIHRTRLRNNAKSSSVLICSYADSILMQLI